LSSSGPAVPVVERHKLGTLRNRLGTGGQAVVYDLPGFHLPGSTEPLVYKEYKAANGVPANLKQVLAVREGLDAARRRRLDTIAVWPLAIVVHSGAPCGVLMRRIPDVFFDDVRLAGTGGTAKVLREVQNLFIPPQRAAGLGRPVPTTEQRIAICRDFAAALIFYHDELSVVFGDINAVNELFRLDSDSRVLFLDCDGVRLNKGSTPTATQLNAPDWEPPERGTLTRATDLYKLGLFILRCLAPGAGMSVRRDPAAADGVLDSHCMALLRRSLGANPLDRPAAGEWWLGLSRMLGEPVAPPTLTDARPDRPFVLAGAELAVTWAATDAVTVEVTAGHHTVTVDGVSGSGTVQVPLHESGLVRVRAINQLGEDSRVIGPVAAVPPPPTTVPLPVGMPALDLRTLPSMVAPTVPPVPHLDLPMIPLDFGALVGTGNTAHTSWPALDSADCPLDVVSLMFDGPELTPGLIPSTKGTR
jgi:hypothetical protein